MGLTHECQTMFRGLQHMFVCRGSRGVKNTHAWRRRVFGCCNTKCSPSVKKRRMCLYSLRETWQQHFTFVSRLADWLCRGFVTAITFCAAGLNTRGQSIYGCFRAYHRVVSFNRGYQKMVFHQ